MRNRYLRLAERVRKSKLRQKLVQEQGGRCYYCGVEFDETSPRHHSTIDHLKPVSKGGDFFPGNCVAACFSCNQERGTRNAEAFRRYKSK